MKNLIVQYYDKYTKDKVSLKEQADGRMPPWMYIGMMSAQEYARNIGVEYMFLTGDQLMDFGTPFLSGQTVVWDDEFDIFDNILLLDADTIIHTKDNIFDLAVDGTVSMVHQWNDPALTRRAHEIPYRRFVETVPHSVYRPEYERNLSGAVQLWSKGARKAARNTWMNPSVWWERTRKTEQPYLNTHLTIFGNMANELPEVWNVSPTYIGTVEGAKIHHYGGQARKYGMFDYVEGKPLVPIAGSD